MGMGQLPEECISHIISFTSPRDACRSSLVSPLFRSASDSDVVWEKFLPSDYKDLISQSATIPETTINSLPKKTLFFYLCNNPIIIGNGNMVCIYEETLFWNQLYLSIFLHISAYILTFFLIFLFIFYEKEISKRRYMFNYYYYFLEKVREKVCGFTTAVLFISF